MAKKVNNTSEYKNRAPIVAIMGHVDHGKTSLLDAFRKTNVQAKEHGGITQHIGAYQIVHNASPITFIDTPGHSAFELMRARGGRASDIVVLVVAADASVQPQTKEAIKHAKAANAQIIVAINKTDLATSDITKVKNDLAMENVIVEDFGGDTLCIEVSAKTGKGLDKLLDAIVTVGEMMELKAKEDGELEAIIIEAKLDRQKGVIVYCIVKNGTLSIGDSISASGYETKVRSLMGGDGLVVKSAHPGTPVEVLGFKHMPNVGDLIVEKGSELAQLAMDENRVEIIGKDTKRTVEIVLRADTQGTLEAVKASLANIVMESAGTDFSLKFLHCATGDISDSDILLASNTKGVVIGFNVKYKATVKELAEDLSVTLKTYSTIYELIENVKDILEGTVSNEEAKIKGRAEVLKVFKLTSGDIVAGCKVVAGTFKLDMDVQIYDKSPADLTANDLPVFSGSIKKLKHGKNDISVAGKNTECGILFRPTFEGIEPGHWVEAR